MTDGVALVAKPAGPTSHDVVDVVRRVLGTARVGHLGTLDPFAAGLLVCVVGRATRLAPFAAGWRKRYHGTVRLGVVTDTDDLTGSVMATSEAWQAVDAARLADAIGRFRGTIAQRPPRHSAVKVDGERAYRKARRGEAVDLAARPVDVHALEVIDFQPPLVEFRATVGAGTYLRSLARDLGDALGCGGHLVALTRTDVGPFRLADAVAPESLRADQVRDPAVLVADLPRCDLSSEERDAAIHGRPITLGAIEGGTPADRLALFADGSLVGVAEVAGNVAKPRVVVVE